MIRSRRNPRIIRARLRPTPVLNFGKVFGISFAREHSEGMRWNRLLLQLWLLGKFFRIPVSRWKRSGSQQAPEGR